jgi:hypothetical protein
MVVKTGRSFDGVHAAVALGLTANGDSSGVSLLEMTGDGMEASEGLADPAVAEMTSSNATVCELPSPNRSLMDAG